jgi:hypothetical protein
MRETNMAWVLFAALKRDRRASTALLSMEAMPDKLRSL